MIAGTPLRPLRGAARRAGRAPRGWRRARTRRDGSAPRSPPAATPQRAHRHSAAPEDEAAPHGPAPRSLPGRGAARLFVKLPF